jgi:hypothetical protein
MSADEPGFVVWSDGRVEHIDVEGDTVGEWFAPTLYGELLTAGYPLHSDQGSTFDGVFDLRVLASGEVQANTTGATPREHAMGEVSEVFLRWYRSEVAS